MRCLLAVCVFVLAAQCAWGGGMGLVYLESSDPYDIGCSLSDYATNLMQVHVIVEMSEPLSELRFAAPLPACMTGALYLTDTSDFTFTGDSQSGATVYLGGCINERTVAMEIQIFGSGLSQTCCVFRPAAHPSDSDVFIADCAGEAGEAFTDPTWVNPNSSCHCHAYHFLPEFRALFPADGAEGVITPLELRWDLFNPEGPGWTRVHFGETTPPPPVLEGRLGETFVPGPMNPGVTYYWRLSTAWDNRWIYGPVWSFTTDDPTPVRASSWGSIKALYQ